MKNPNEDILLTEDGHPIGEVVLADNAAVPVDSNDRQVEENRADLLAQKAMELTGETTPDAAVVALYPGYEDSDKRKRAMAIVVSDGRSIEEAAEAVGVPPRTVAQWSYVGKWADLVRQEIAARHEQSLLQLSRIRSERRVTAAKAQLEQAQKLRDKAAEAVLREETSVKSGTEAWAAAAKVEQTLIGMAESGAVADLEGKDQKKDDKSDGKTPLVVVFQGGGLPPIRRA